MTSFCDWPTVATAEPGDEEEMETEEDRKFAEPDSFTGLCACLALVLD